MKIESWLFLGLVPYCVIVGVVYGFMVQWQEPVGFLGLLLTGGLCGMVGWYLMHTGRRVGPRPEDRVDGEIHENAGVVGAFAPWSWWPLILSAGTAIGFLGLAIGWWILFLGVGLTVAGLVGWVYEYSRGDHAH